MPPTFRSDLYSPEILTDAIKAEFSGMIVLQGSPAVVLNDRLPGNIAGQPIKGGSIVTVPYFNAMGTMLQKVANEGDALTPQKLSMSSETASVGHFGFAGELTSWAQYAAAFADPYGEMARQFKVMTVKRVEFELIAAAPTGLDASLVNDLTVGGTVLGSTINYDNVIDSKLKWAEEQEQIVLMSVHSKVYGDMLKLKDALGRPLLVDPNDGSLAKFAGIPVKVSDLNTVTADGFGNVYQSLIFKAGALVWWYQSTPRIRGLGDPLTDADITAIHTYGVAYRYKHTPGFTKAGVVKLLTR